MEDYYTKSKKMNLLSKFNSLLVLMTLLLSMPVLFAQEVPKIFVSGDVQIVGLDGSVQIVKIMEPNQLDAFELNKTHCFQS